jgi:carboxypeptidase family protein
VSTKPRSLIVAAVRLLGIIGLLWAAQSPAFAQLGNAGIIGQVRDDTGSVLPGVTVTATGPALQVPQVITITDAEGGYRLSPLPIGLYTVTYALPGFQTLSQANIRLEVAFVAKVDQVMKIGALTETVTVTRASPLVDVVASGTKTDLSQETLTLLPTNHDGLKVYLGQTPSVREPIEVGTSGVGAALTYSVYGQTGKAWQLLEGVNQVKGQGPGHIEFDAIEGVVVQTVANDAEVPERGVYINVRLKSGGNQFHGDAGYSFMNHTLASTNITPVLTAQGIANTPTLRFSHLANANVGGRIIRDKLWFFGAVYKFWYNQDTPTTVYPDGRPFVNVRRLYNDTVKLSYQLTPSNQIVGMIHSGYKHLEEPTTQFSLPEATRNVTLPITYNKLEWRAVNGNSFVTSLQYGYGDTTIKPKQGIAPNKPSTLDLATQVVGGDYTLNGQVTDAKTHQVAGSVSAFRTSFLGGAHAFKAGIDYYWYDGSTHFLNKPSGPYQLIFNRGVPFELLTWNMPNTPDNYIRYADVYAQDSWTLAHRLTLNLGLRYAHDNAYVNAQCQQAGQFVAAQCYDKVQFPMWSTVAPRLHASYDVTGDGKSVIRGGYSSFNTMHEITEIALANPVALTSTTWRWHDLSGDGLYQPGEVNLDPAGADFVSGGVKSKATPSPNLVDPRDDEFSIGFQREVLPNLALQITGIYTRSVNTMRVDTPLRPASAYTVPITNPDPGPDGVLGTSDDPGKFFTYYEYPTALAAASFGQQRIINDPRAAQTYKTIEVSAVKRLAQGWTMSASAARTKKHVPLGTDLSLAINPNVEFLAADNTSDWTEKVSGTYDFPHGIMASATFENRSGAPGARQVLFSGGTTIPTFVLNVVPIGSVRLPSINLLNVQVEKRVRLGNRTLALKLMVYNALNINTLTAWNLRAGPKYLWAVAPTGTGASPTIVGARIAQVGLAYTF